MQACRKDTEFHSMEDRIRLLEAVIPEIHLRAYKVVGLSLVKDRWFTCH